MGREGYSAIDSAGWEDLIARITRGQDMTIKDADVPRPLHPA